jgi:hypothetical protein
MKLKYITPALTLHKKIYETSGGTDVTGQYAPTNSLLKKEMDPAAGESHSKLWDANLNDEFVDKSRLDQITDTEPRPGEGSQYPQSDGKSEYFDSEYDFNDTEDDEEDDDGGLTYTLKNKKLTIDPANISENIINPTTKGSLFKRDPFGKTMITGIKTGHCQQQMQEQKQKIEDLINIASHKTNEFYPNTHSTSKKHRLVTEITYTPPVSDAIAQASILGTNSKVDDMTAAYFQKAAAKVT